METFKRRNIWIAIFLGGFLLRFFLVWHPPQHYFDEVYFAYTAQEMSKGNVEAWKVSTTAPKGFAFAWNHPFLGKEIMGLSVKLFGDHPVGWRMSSVLFGAASSVATFVLGEILFGTVLGGLLVSFLFTVDGLMFTMSRISTTDIILLFWHLITFIGIARYVKTGHWSDALLASVGSGLSFATKWSGITTIPLVGIFVCLPILIQGDESWTHRLRRVLLLFIGIPAAIYFLVHIPQWIATGFSWKEVWEVQKQTWFYHKNLKATHPHQSAWWQWPLMLRSLWFYVDYSQWGKGWVGNIYALGNPFIWWGGVVGMLVLAWKTIRTRDVVASFIVGGFLISWLPWAASPRISFLYHYMPALVFIILALVYWLSQAWSDTRYRKWACTYIGVVLVAFCIFYPIYIGVRVPNWYFQSLMWLPSWR